MRPQENFADCLRLGVLLGGGDSGARLRRVNEVVHDSRHGIGPCVGTKNSGSGVAREFEVRRKELSFPSLPNAVVNLYICVCVFYNLDELVRDFGSSISYLFHEVSLSVAVAIKHVVSMHQVPIHVHLRVKKIQNKRSNVTK